jgi:hypothetical protein
VTLVIFPARVLFLWAALYVGYGLVRSAALQLAK